MPKPRCESTTTSAARTAGAPEIAHLETSVTHADTEITHAVTEIAHATPRVSPSRDWRAQQSDSLNRAYPNWHTVHPLPPRLRRSPHPCTDPCSFPFSPQWYLRPRRPPPRLPVAPDLLTPAFSPSRSLPPCTHPPLHLTSYSPPPPPPPFPQWHLRPRRASPRLAVAPGVGGRLPRRSNHGRGRHRAANNRPAQHRVGRDEAHHGVWRAGVNVKWRV
jgi:hypothetical protein